MQRVHINDLELSMLKTIRFEKCAATAADSVFDVAGQKKQVAPAIVELKHHELSQVGGGLAPNGTWSYTTEAPNGNW